MITPLDIQNKKFKKSALGYASKEVDEYLKFINTDYEKLYRENVELKDKIGVLTDQIRQYNNLEETLKNTLVLAQTTADEVTKNARKKSNLIIEEAELKSKDRLNEARDQVKNIKIEYEQLKKEMLVFKNRYESFINSQLISLENFYTDFEEETGKVEDLEEENLEEKIFEEEGLEEIENLNISEA